MIKLAKIRVQNAVLFNGDILAHFYNYVVI